jgi:hypothetical protein
MITRSKTDLVPAPTALAVSQGNPALISPSGTFAWSVIWLVYKRTRSRSRRR